MNKIQKITSDQRRSGVLLQGATGECERLRLLELPARSLGLTVTGLAGDLSGDCGERMKALSRQVPRQGEGLLPFLELKLFAAWWRLSLGDGETLWFTWRGVRWWPRVDKVAVFPVKSRTWYLTVCSTLRVWPVSRSISSHCFFLTSS